MNSKTYLKELPCVQLSILTNNDNRFNNLEIIMKKLSFIFIVTFFYLVLSLVLANDNLAIPTSIKNISESTFRLNFTIFGEENSKGRCSATRISDKYVLTAAHCVVGFMGNSHFDNFYFEFNDKKYFLSLIEKGQFSPNETNEISDWAVLEIAQTDINELSTIKPASFPSKQKILEIINNLGDFANSQNLGTEIWSITYPIPSVRQPPRPAPDGNKFISKGYLKTELAYKKSILFGIRNNHIYDEIFEPHDIDLNIDVESEWAKLENHPQWGGIFFLAKMYKQNTNSLIYQTSDFSGGSSGGGIFIKDNGELIGIRVVTSTLVQPKKGYNGINQLYRIDKICKESKLLSKLDKCKLLQ
ncbi:MAG: hypothetical protein A2381_03805 [Bdellovibrionales bacterium RIFOXYB1_FULL_37_110]|nr:MAG: hypothetical protein A2417_16400 [Bdellovibrionales bacterium RIFOXYC1_FULL_37_79]OFZ59161.1 MAG: hypothetical protein A2381_03805 [Bdellovibrionales bacterium RIFOXYB1_FULL_37_110]OFZ64166.1 MAG: hypothetical protein A2577_14835 [Bdellovibrionales bacterium RIFOXYD1_FULL_36_51]